MTVPATEPPRLPLRTRAEITTRLFAIQGSWNYELLVGPGIGFVVEPALRHLPGGSGGTAYRAALARQSRYFNAHPYLTAVAVGALARAELDGAPPAQIERFRTALCGPLGSVGDRLIWAGWLPFCSLVALLAFGLGAGAAGVLLIFLVTYNTGHVALRLWGLRVGWRQGLRVASALGHPVLRQGPQQIARIMAFLAGAAVPLAVRRTLELRAAATHLPGVREAASRVRHAALPDPLLPITLAAAAVVALVMIRLHGRVNGWRVALLVLAATALYSIAR